MLYIPRESIPLTDQRVPGAVAYCYKTVRGDPAAIAYTAGAKKNHAFNVAFRDTIRRSLYIQNWFNNLADHEAAKQERRDSAKTWHHGYQPGDILNGSWGYDQTNQEFYQVMEVSATSNSIVIREITHNLVSSERDMSGQVTPNKDQFNNDPPRRVMAQRPHNGLGKGDFHINVHGGRDDGFRIFLDEWNGKPVYESWYA
jgi:hypothetical protein